MPELTPMSHQHLEGDDVQNMVQDSVSDDDFIDTTDSTELENDEIMDSSDTSSDTEDSGSSVEDLWEDDDFATEEVWTMERQNVGFSPYKNKDKCYTPDEATRPFDFYKIFFTQDFLIEVVNSTNEYAAALLAAGGENIHSWDTLTLPEFETFLGTFFVMGSVRMKNISEYWDVDPDWIDFYPRHFIAKKRFLAIFKCLRFGRDHTNGLIDYFNKKMIGIFTPEADLTIDTHYINFNSRQKFKLHRLATASGIILKIAKHKTSDEEDDKQMMRNKIVKELLEEYLNTGRHVYMDKYYNNLNLATWLVKTKTNVTGLLYPRKESDPRVVVAAKLKKAGSIHRYSSIGICICKWHDDEDILALSSVHGPARKFLPKKRQRGKVLGYPDMSIKYYETMTKLDTYDLLMDYYVLKMKWMAKDKKIGLHILQIMLLNSFLLYKLKKNKPRLSYHRFRNSVFISFLPMHLIPLNQPADCVEAA
ncbi:hypothetical protein evm_004158 [Chilo suppressalis]|nr:hypothetical protein evm_004158 [Chilo suppressalis]